MEEIDPESFVLELPQKMVTCMQNLADDAKACLDEAQEMFIKELTVNAMQYPHLYRRPICTRNDVVMAVKLMGNGDSKAILKIDRNSLMTTTNPEFVDFYFSLAAKQLRKEQEVGKSLPTPVAMEVSPSELTSEFLRVCKPQPTVTTVLAQEDDPVQVPEVQPLWEYETFYE